MLAQKTSLILFKICHASRRDSLGPTQLGATWHHLGKCATSLRPGPAATCREVANSLYLTGLHLSHSDLATAAGSATWHNPVHPGNLPAMSPSQLHCTPLSTATCHPVIRQRTAHGTHAAITNLAGFLNFPASRQVACRIFEIFRLASWRLCDTWQRARVGCDLETPSAC